MGFLVQEYCTVTKMLAWQAQNHELDSQYKKKNKLESQFIKWIC